MGWFNHQLETYRRYQFWDPSVLKFLFGNFLQLWGVWVRLGYLPTLCGLRFLRADRCFPTWSDMGSPPAPYKWMAENIPWVFLGWNFSPQKNGVISPGPYNWRRGPTLQSGQNHSGAVCLGTSRLRLSDDELQGVGIEDSVPGDSGEGGVLREEFEVVGLCFGVPEKLWIFLVIL